MKIEKKNFVENFFIYLLLLVVPILQSNATLDPNLTIQLTATSVGLFLFSLYILKKTSSSTNFLINAPLLVSFSIFIIYSIYSAYISSIQADAWFIFCKYFLWFTLFILFALSSEKVEFKHISLALFLLNLIIIIPGIIEFIVLISTKKLLIPLSTYQVRSLFPHRNILVEIIALCIPFSIYFYFSQAKKYWKYISLFVIDCTLFLIIVLSNRASWIAISLAGFFCIILYLTKNRKANFIKEHYSFFLHFLIVLFLGIIVISNFSSGNTFEKHALNTFNIEVGSAKDRFGLWQRTASIVHEKPIFGHGLESWKIEILKYGNEGLESENNLTFYQRPHNDLLWIAAEQGLLGLLIYLSFFIIFLVLLLREYFNNEKKIDKPVYLTISALLIIYFSISFFSFPKERITHNVILFLSMGYFAGSQFRKNIRLPRTILYIFPIILISIFYLGYERYNGEKHTRLAIEYRNTGNYEECINEIDLAFSKFYTMDPTSTPLSWYAGTSYFGLHEFEKAKVNFQQAYHLNPYHIRVLNDFASCYIKLNQVDSAINIYYLALKYAPNFIDAKLNLCAVYFRQKQYEKAFEILKTMEIAPSNERYMKTLTIILKSSIMDAIKKNNLDINIIKTFNLEGNKIDFYLKLITIAKQQNYSLNLLLNSI